MDAAQIAEAVLAARQGGPPLLVATVITAPAAESARVGAKMIVRADGSFEGSLGADALDDAVRREAPDAFRRRGVEVVYLNAAGDRVDRGEASASNACQVMLEVHEPPESLLIIGGGHVGKALATIGQMCGFSVEVVDDRPEYANKERFPEADKITCGRFEDVLDGYPIGPATYVVCVTRGHKHDETSLRLVAESGAAYVGMIGSKRRVGAVLQHLLEDGVDPAAVERVHSPIGLDIGAETPEEIAVSVMAEIVMARRGGGGGPMRGSMGKKQGLGA